MGADKGTPIGTLCPTVPGQSRGLGGTVDRDKVFSLSCPVSRPRPVTDVETFKADYKRRVARAVHTFMANAPTRERRTRWKGVQ